VDAIRKLREKGIEAEFQLLGAIDEKHKRGIPSKIVHNWIEGKEVNYLGTTDNVKQLIRQSDCVVLPSYREGTPKTLLEAASMGIPIVATDVPGCRNVVENGHNGYLCKMKNADDLADKMLKVYQLDPEKRAEMGVNSRKKVEKEFDVQLVIDKYHSAMAAL
jgi:glycosyltransferase involved in cell wall biosynthesis